MLENNYVIATLWAKKILAGCKTYEQVPRGLKEAVRKILEASGTWK